MTISEIKDKMHRVLHIKVEDISRTDVISVRQDVSLTDWIWGEATVNWSAVGEVTSPQALDFAEALKVAADKANEWNKDAGTKMERPQPEISDKTVCKKIRTEDCVAFLVAYKGGWESQWKRRSKRNVGDVVERVFQNVKTLQTISVYEKDGKMSFECDKPGAGYLFAIADNPDLDPEWVVYVTSRSYWQKHHCMDDNNADASLGGLMQRVGLYESMESCFEPDGQHTRKVTKEKLEEMGFVNDSAFQKFAERDEE